MKFLLKTKSEIGFHFHSTHCRTCTHNASFRTHSVGWLANALSLTAASGSTLQSKYFRCSRKYLLSQLVLLLAEGNVRAGNSLQFGAVRAYRWRGRMCYVKTRASSHCEHASHESERRSDHTTYAYEQHSEMHRICARMNADDPVHLSRCAHAITRDKTADFFSIPFSEFKYTRM